MKGSVHPICSANTWSALKTSGITVTSDIAVSKDNVDNVEWH